MDEGWKYIRFEDVELTDLGNGFLGSNVVELDDLELTFVKGDKGSGHGFHHHEDLVEILIFLEGGCAFTVGETDLNIKAASLLFMPPGVNHKVHYNEKSKVLRIKIPRPSEESGDASKDSIQARLNKTKRKEVKNEGKSVKLTEMNY